MQYVSQWRSHGFGMGGGARNIDIFWQKVSSEHSHVFTLFTSIMLGLPTPDFSTVHDGPSQNGEGGRSLVARPMNDVFCSVIRVQ